jgi:hypothetical protein
LKRIHHSQEPRILMHFFKRRQGAKSANRRQERREISFASCQLVASSRRYGCSFVTADDGRHLEPCATPNQQKSLGELGALGGLASFEKMHHVDTTSLAIFPYWGSSLLEFTTED